MASEQLQALLGTEFVRNNKEKVSVDTLAGKYIGIYFSAHWCGPCRAFTPKLAEAYNSFLKQKNFEIIFASSDRDEHSFDEYFATMPWLALPFSDRQRKQNLSKKYKVSGIPSLVIISPDGQLVNKNGREAISSDPRGNQFPWAPKTLFQILGTDFQRNDGTTVNFDTFKDGYIGLYFSASWCPPCQAFTPVLIDVYNKVKADGKKFEIIFVSADQEEDAFDGYFKKMPWLTVPFDDQQRNQDLSRHFEVEGIPSLAILDGRTGRILNVNGVSAVRADPTGASFPWPPKPFYDLSDDASDINDYASLLVVLTNVSDDEKTRIVNDVAVVAEKYFKEVEAGGEKRFAFYTATKKVPLVDRIFKLVGVQSGSPASLVLLDVPGGGVYYTYDAKEVNVATIEQFLDAYSKEQLPPKQFNR